MATTEAPTRRYRIGEVGRLTGFEPTTLRFYENAGVLAPPPRTPAGYRTYDDRDVERLRLIARAKDLGCTLDEIADLVQAWDADECAPVKHRLRSLVGAKVDEVQRHIAEQVAFAAELQATAVALADRPVDGPCGDDCGCTTSVASQPDEDGPATSPIACALGSGDVAARVDEWQTVLAGVQERQAIRNGVRLRFGEPAPLVEIARLAGAEHDCCPFFAFAVTIDERGVALEVTAPPDGQALLDTVFGATS